MSSKTAFSGQPDYWEKYMRYRPEYPPELYERIYAFHSAHSLASHPWKSAHDVGSGVGIAAVELGRQFDSLIVSDPSEDNIEAATDYLHSQSLKAEVSFVVAAAEDLNATPTHNPIDLLASGEAIMWADHEKTMVAAANAIKPGGTIAFWTYHVRPQIRIAQNPSLREELQEKLDALYEKMLPEMLSFVGYDRMAIPHIHLMMNMDTWAFDEEHWTNVRRVHWNRPTITSSALSKLISSTSSMPSAVRASEIVEHVNADLLRRESVDYGWIELYHKEIYPGYEPLANMRDQLDNLEEAFTKLPGGRVDVAFPATLLLATRKEY